MTAVAAPRIKPDPKITSWMRGYRAENPAAGLIDIIKAYADGHGGYRGLRNDGIGLATLKASCDASAGPPLTPVDIPAGQGPASLYIGPGHRGELAVMYRTGLDHDHVFMTEGRDDPTEARRALWEHLAATLPTVTREETQP